MASEQFSLCWDNFHKNMSSGMNSLLESEDLVDVTLAVQGKCLKAHKMVLSVCSPYFKELFKSNPCQHPIVFMKDVSYEALSDLLQFMYQGEVQVSQENLTTFIKTAEALQIKGLTGDGNGSTDTDTVETHEKPMPQPRVEEYKPAVTVPRPKKQPPPSPIVTASPSIKRQRLSQSSDSQPLPPVTKTEPISSTPPSQSLPSEPVHFKMEPYDQTHSLIDETGDENFGDDTLDDTAVDDTEDYSMMEGNVGGEDEPQAGTSTDGAGEGQALGYLLLKYCPKITWQLLGEKTENPEPNLLVKSKARRTKKRPITKPTKSCKRPGISAAKAEPNLLMESKTRKPRKGRIGPEVEIDYSRPVEYKPYRRGPRVSTEECLRVMRRYVHRLPPERSLLPGPSQSIWKEICVHFDGKWKARDLYRECKENRHNVWTLLHPEDQYATRGQPQSSSEDTLRLYDPVPVVKKEPFFAEEPTTLFEESQLSSVHSTNPPPSALMDVFACSHQSPRDSTEGGPK